MLELSPYPKSRFRLVVTASCNSELDHLFPFQPSIVLAENDQDSLTYFNGLNLTVAGVRAFLAEGISMLVTWKAVRIFRNSGARI